MASIPLQKLVELYGEKSKHSAYQVLAPSVAKILGSAPLHTESRHEVSRMRCIVSQVPLRGSRVLDIGGNTGFFTFSAFENGASNVDFYEGNRSHSQFVETCALALGLDERVNVHAEYYEFPETDPGTPYDICFCLNVLHHLGDDFGDTTISMEDAKVRMVTSINNLARASVFLVLQIGYNWQGDIRRPLFANGLKSELIDFISQGVDGFWDIVSTQVADSDGGIVTYSPVNEKNIERLDNLGEFLNRPMIFLKSKLL